MPCRFVRLRVWKTRTIPVESIFWSLLTSLPQTRGKFHQKRRGSPVDTLFGNFSPWARRALLGSKTTNFINWRKNHFPTSFPFRFLIQRVSSPAWIRALIFLWSFGSNRNWKFILAFFAETFSRVLRRNRAIGENMALILWKLLVLKARNGDVRHPPRFQPGKMRFWFSPKNHANDLISRLPLRKVGKAKKNLRNLLMMT